MSDPIDWQGRRQHGTRSSYSGGCRCTPCRQAQAEANRYISDCLIFFAVAGKQWVTTPTDRVGTQITVSEAVT